MSKTGIQRWLSLLLALIMLLAVTPGGVLPVVAADTAVLSFTVADGAATVVGCSSGADGELVIPDTYEGYPVTAIEAYAFNYCISLDAVTIPASVTSVAPYAFPFCQSLVSITVAAGNPVYIAENNCLIEAATGLMVVGCRTSKIPVNGVVTAIGEGAFMGSLGPVTLDVPQGVTSIGKCAFANCSNLVTVNFPTSLTAIGESAFSGCGLLGSLSIPEGVTTIQPFTFKQSGLQSIELPSTLKVIGDHAFYYCYRLNGITLPGNLKSMGAGAFEGANLVEVLIPTGLSALPSRAFAECTLLEAVDLQASLLTIGDGAFYGCDSLYDISIPEGVVSIGGSAFAGCLNLNKVTIPASVTGIGEAAYAECGRLGSLEVNEHNPVYYAQDNCLIERATGVLVQGCYNSLIPDDGSITAIGNNAFSGCDALQTVVVPAGVKTIGSNAFRNCTALELLAIPQGVTGVGNNAFFGCSALTELRLPDSVVTMGDGVFRGCSLLRTVTLPNTITIIKRDTFYECNSLESVTIPAGVERIEGASFYDCDNLTAITIPAAVKYIDINPFTFCDKLTTFTVEAGNTAYIAAGNCLIDCRTGMVIAGCKASLIPDDGSVTGIAIDAFTGCAGLTEVSVPAGVTTVESQAFAYCAELVSVTLPATITSLGDYVFDGCPWELVIYCSSGYVQQYAENYGITYVRSYSGAAYKGTQACEDADGSAAIRFGFDVACTGVSRDDGCNTVIADDATVTVDGQSYKLLSFGANVALEKDVAAAMEGVDVPANKLYSVNDDGTVTYTVRVNGLTANSSDNRDTPIYMNSYVRYEDNGELKTYTTGVVCSTYNDVYYR